MDTFDIKSQDLQGWASLRLVSAICNRDSQKLSQISEGITNNYTQEEIKTIWKRTKLILTEEDITWLEDNLKQLTDSY